VGLEIASGAEALGALRAELSATLLDPRDTTEARVIKNDLIPFRARLVVSPYVEFFTEPSSHPLGLDRASFGTRAFYRSAEVTDPAGLIVIDAQAIVDADFTLSFLDQRITSRVRLANVFNAPNFDVVGYPLPGRSLHASVEAWW
jgi:iron complex outermembrane receptor protein